MTARRLDELQPELAALYRALIQMRMAAPAVEKPGAAKEARRASVSPSAP